MVNVDPPLLSFPASWTLATLVTDAQNLEAGRPRADGPQPAGQLSLGRPPASTCRAPAQRPQLGGQLEQAERLDQVVIRARAETADPVSDAISSRQHQHGNPVSASRSFWHNREPVEARQVHIQDDGLVGVLRRQPQPFRAIGRDIRRVALLPQRTRQQPGYANLVLRWRGHRTPRRSRGRLMPLTDTNAVGSSARSAPPRYPAVTAAVRC
jgi:hypothetical protein